MAISGIFMNLIQSFIHPVKIWQALEFRVMVVLCWFNCGTSSLDQCNQTLPFLVNSMSLNVLKYPKFLQQSVLWTSPYVGLGMLAFLGSGDGHGVLLIQLGRDSLSSDLAPQRLQFRADAISLKHMMLRNEWIWNPHSLMACKHFSDPLTITVSIYLTFSR